MLFELSHHSDHYFVAYKKYHTLELHESSHKLTSRYIVMILLSFFPPDWFWIVNPLLEKINRS